MNPMRDASTEIFAAIRAALIADAVLAPRIGQRITSDWGLELAAPFVRLRVPEVTPWHDDCRGKGSEYTIELHVFTRENGITESVTLVDRIATVLDETELALSSSTMWWLLLTGTIRVTDPDDPGLQVARVTFASASTNGN